MSRRFGWLNSRVLLYRQDELAKLEETLIDMDGEDISYKGGLALKSRREDDDRRDVEEQYSRRMLINQIDTKLKEYREFSLPHYHHFLPALNVKAKRYEKLIYQYSPIDELISRVHALFALKRPSARNFNSLKNWMIDQKPVTRDEMQFIGHPGDFVALADRQEVGWFDGFVQDCLTKIPKDLARVRFFNSYPCPLISILSNARPYRNSSPDRKNSPNPTTLTCTCTQATASPSSSA